ncbi:MAG: GAF domain-containing sensor histidine kinase [Chloroflexota bacterium]|nr:GAF domain-containing sensor histidine kinase [Chloroflexota bacterium]
MAATDQSQIVELNKRIAILTRITEISAALNSQVKLKPLLGMIMDASVEIAEAEAASVLLWDPKTNELRFATTTTGDDSDTLIGIPVPLEGSIAGSVLLENRTVMVNDVRRDRRHYGGVDKQTDFQTRSVLGVPMRVKNRVIGVLEAVNKRVLPWTADDASNLATLASQAAVALESAQMVSALQKANEELNRLDKLKSDFIAIASHELRTPLGVILGYASFLQDTGDPEVREHADKVVGSALQLRRIIEDLTNLRYIEQNPTNLTLVQTPLAQFLSEVVHDALGLSNAKGHRLQYIPPTPEILVDVDAPRLTMAITNILNNAIRFTPEGGRIMVQTKVQPSRQVWVLISDTGIGLAREQLERVFDRFYQVEDHMTRREGGLGIGLSIARALVEAHSGRIWASSTGLNQGTTVTIALPLSK